MANERAIALLQETLDKTKSKKLKWQATAQTGIFVAPMGGKYTIKVFPFTDGSDESGPPSLTLFEEGDLLLDCTVKSTANPNGILELYNLVRNQVFRIDEKNKSIEDAITLLRNL